MAKSKKVKYNKKNKNKKNKNTRRNNTKHVSIIDKNLYPFWYNKIPFPQVSNNKLMDEKIWVKHLKLASKLYENKSSLPKGSILFHGSGIIDPIADLRMTDDPFFFGLDAFIAIWYISEWAIKHVSDIERLLNSLVKEESSEFVIPTSRGNGRS